MSLLDKEAVKRAEKVLKKFNNKLNIVILDNSARTAKEAAISLNCTVGAIVKSLLFRSVNSYILCLVAGDRRCSLRKLKKLTNQKDISMATPEEVKT